MKRKRASPVFKPNIMNQPALIPPSWDVARVVNRTIEKIDLELLFVRYKGAG